VVLFDEADGLFAKRTAVNGSSDRYANMDVGLLLYHVERFPGIVLLTTNLREEIDEAFYRRLLFVVEFAPPDESARKALWKHLMPPNCPGVLDLQTEALAEHPLTGGQIRTIILKVAARAALRPNDARISMMDLEEAVADELRNERRPRMGFTAS
jgi:SpoVK/Ycf46/Vps4 family AAA+-type ATPase